MKKTDAIIGYLGMETGRDRPRAARLRAKLPTVEGRRALVVDPMLGRRRQRRRGAASVKRHHPCVVALAEGLAKMRPTTPMSSVTGALDSSTIRTSFPGLGDFGDQLYGTP